MFEAEFAGFQEGIDQRCLAIELGRATVKFVPEQEQLIYYDGIEVGTRRADFVIEERLILKIKARFGFCRNGL